jgi:hypothetical protein
MTVGKNTALQNRSDQADNELAAQQKAEILAALDKVPAADAWGVAFIDLLKKGVAEGHRVMSVDEIREYLGRPTYEEA